MKQHLKNLAAFLDSLIIEPAPIKPQPNYNMYKYQARISEWSNPFLQLQHVCACKSTYKFTLNKF
jgi:hypothetical protein